MLVLILSAEFIAINILKDASLVTIIKLSSFFLFFNSIFGVLVGALSGLERFKQIAFSTLLSGIFGAFIIVWATNLYLLEGVVWGYSIFYFVSDVLLLYFLVMEAKSMNIVFSLDFIKYKEECAQFFNFSMPAFISAAIGGPTTWGVYAIAANLPNGFFYIGIFNVAKILQNTLIQIGTQLNSPLLALIGNIEKSKHADRLNFAVPWLVITLLTFPFILVPEIFTFFFKNDNYNVPELDMVVAMVAFTTYVMLFKQSFARKIITEDLMWWGVIENIFWAISILIAVPLLIEKQNVLGLPNAFALVYFVDLLILIPFYYRKGLIPRELISWRAILCWLIVFGCLGMNFIDISMQLKLTIGLASILIELFLIYSLFFRRYII